MKSMSTLQLYGSDKSIGDLGDCSPAKSIVDIGYSTNPAGYSGGRVGHYQYLLANHSTAFPCGLVAKSMFNGKLQDGITCARLVQHDLEWSCYSNK